MLRSHLIRCLKSYYCIHLFYFRLSSNGSSVKSCVFLGRGACSIITFLEHLRDHPQLIEAGETEEGLELRGVHGGYRESQDCWTMVRQGQGNALPAENTDHLCSVMSNRTLLIYYVLARQTFPVLKPIKPVLATGCFASVFLLPESLPFAGSLHLSPFSSL